MGLRNAEKPSLPMPSSLSMPPTSPVGEKVLLCSHSCWGRSWLHAFTHRIETRFFFMLVSHMTGNPCGQGLYLLFLFHFSSPSTE